MQSARRQLAVFLAVYAVALALLLPHLSLWLDEVLTLLGAVQPDLNALLDYLKTVPGGTPLAFLVPHWSIAVFGNSAFTARLPSALASIAACPAVYFLAQRMRLRRPILAVLVFALWPMQFRYALEARPYALALALTVWTTELFLSLLEHPSSKLRIGLYALLTVAATLTQPYAIFIPVAHLVWAGMTNRAAVRIPAFAILLAALAILPWYLYFRGSWSMVTAEQNLGPGNWWTILVFFHEFAGSGYAGTALLLGGLALGLRRVTELRLFWLLSAVIPLVLVPLGNSVFHYFFAIRQLIYNLPVCALLYVRGAESAGRLGNIVLAAFLAVSLYEDISWFRKPREDWQAAAAALQNADCVTFVDDSKKIYSYFVPAVKTCTEEATQVVLAISPYGDAQAAPNAEKVLAARGFTKQSEQSFNGPRVVVYRR
ncbi:MAG: glycosyltransferase family 39 protein [Acidobacteriota bacterium]